MTVKFRKSDPAAVLPAYAHPDDAGMDVRSVEEATIEPGGRRLVRTGLVMMLPSGYEAQVRPRSGLALKNGVTVANFGTTPFKVEKGAKIAQIVIAPCTRAAIVETAEMDETARGPCGFGSTGV